MLRNQILRGAIVGGLLLGAAGVGVVTSAPAGASGGLILDLQENVNATTTLAKLNQTVVIPTGTFVGTLNATSGALKGSLKLPPASTTVSIGGIGLAKATFALEPTKPVRGKLHTGLRITATSTFNIVVRSLTPLGTSINLVGARCETSTPVSLAFSGLLSMTGPSSFSGTYTIPKLAHCELMTTALNAVLAGPGNTFSATMSEQ